MLLLTLLFASSAVATPLPGTEACARGPPYWCQNVKTASQCGAVTHCQTNVWNQPQMKSVPCDLCKEVLIVVENLLKDNATEAEILQYLEKACQLIPDQGLTAQCKEMVDSYYPILIGIITGELDDPGVVCSAMGLCKSQQASLAQVHAHEQLPSNEIPAVDLPRQVSPFLLNVPGLLYPQETLEQDPPQPDTQQQGGDQVCEDCVRFLTDAQAEAKANTSFINALIQNIENQCDLLGPGLSDMCKQYVGQYGILVVQQLMSMQPKEICTMAGFCPAAAMMALKPATMMAPAARVVPMSKLVPALKTVPKRLVRVRDSPTCAICEFVMKQLESMLEDESTEEEVIAAVEKVCTLLPSSLTAQCQDLLQTYGQAIIQLLLQEADPRTVCTVLALCNGAARSYVAALDQSRFGVGGYCEVCKMAVNYVDGILEKNATEAQIEQAVKKVCSFLPASYQTECDQLIEQYEPVIVQLLLQTLDPDFVCMKVGACPEVENKLVGAEQCTWGPRYWCRTELHKTRMELSDLMEKFSRLHETCSSTQQTNNLLERKLQSVAENMEGERVRLNQRISELTEQLTDAKIASSMEVTSVLHKINLHSQTDGAIIQVIPSIAPPPAEFMDSQSYGNDNASVQEQHLGSVPEEEESDWSEVGEDTPQFILTGSNRGQAWRRQEIDMDKDSESGGEDVVRPHSPRPLQIPHLQFTIHNDFMQPSHTSSFHSGFANLSDNISGEESYRITKSPNLGSLLIRSASLEEIPLAHHHMQKELRGTEAMMDLHHSADETIEVLDNEIIHHWRMSNARGTVIRGMADSSLSGLQSAEQMLTHLLCDLPSSHGREPGTAEVHGWSGGIPEEVLKGERTQL